MFHLRQHEWPWPHPRATTRVCPYTEGSEGAFVSGEEVFYELGVGHLFHPRLLGGLGAGSSPFTLSDICVTVISESGFTLTLALSRQGRGDRTPPNPTLILRRAQHERPHTTLRVLRSSIGRVFHLRQHERPPAPPQGNHEGLPLHGWGGEGAFVSGEEGGYELGVGHFSHPHSPRRVFDSSPFPPPLILRLGLSTSGPTPPCAYFDPPLADLQQLRAGSSPFTLSDICVTVLSESGFTLTLALSHRGRGDRTPPLTHSLRILQGSRHGRGDWTIFFGPV